MAKDPSYKFTVRFTASEIEELREAARDAPLTRYVRQAALRDARSLNSKGAAFEPDLGTGLGFYNPPPFSGEEK